MRENGVSAPGEREPSRASACPGAHDLETEVTEIEMLESLRRWIRGHGDDEDAIQTLRADEESAPAGPLIRFEGVSRVFGSGDTRTEALDDVSLTIDRGEFVEVEGPSGCGKTTLLSVMGLLDAPTSGRYVLAGHDVTGLSASRKAWLRNREIGFIFQSFNLIGDLTVFENVELPLTYLGLGKAERGERVQEVLERFGIADRAQSHPSQLSGGHQQRVGVARAVVTRPEILLADEPTGNLNSEQAEAVIDMLAELHAGGSTICLVTHDPRWRPFARRTIHMFDGRLVSSDEAARD